MVFHEITKPAILAAVDNPRQLDDDLVDAQEARRILDRLYGYEVSPVLWKKVMSGLSAGRVQSVATRLVVDKERERMAFRAASYWDLEGTFDAGSKPRGPADVPGQPVSSSTAGASPRGSDFGQDGTAAEADRRASSTSTERAAEALRRGPQRHDVRRPLGGVEALQAARRTRRSAPRRCSRRRAASSA